MGIQDDKGRAPFECNAPFTRCDPKPSEAAVRVRPSQARAVAVRLTGVAVLLGVTLGILYHFIF